MVNKVNISGNLDTYFHSINPITHFYPIEEEYSALAHGEYSEEKNTGVDPAFLSVDPAFFGGPDLVDETLVPVQVEKLPVQVETPVPMTTNLPNFDVPGLTFIDPYFEPESTEPVNPFLDELFYGTEQKAAVDQSKVNRLPSCIFESALAIPSSITLTPSNTLTVPGQMPEYTAEEIQRCKSLDKYSSIPAHFFEKMKNTPLNTNAFIESLKSVDKILYARVLNAFNCKHVLLITRYLIILELLKHYAELSESTLNNFFNLTAGSFRTLILKLHPQFISRASSLCINNPQQKFKLNAEIPESNLYDSVLKEFEKKTQNQSLVEQRTANIASIISGPQPPPPTYFKGSVSTTSLKTKQVDTNKVNLNSFFNMQTDPDQMPSYSESEILKFTQLGKLSIPDNFFNQIKKTSFRTNDFIQTLIQLDKSLYAHALFDANAKRPSNARKYIVILELLKISPGLSLSSLNQYFDLKPESFAQLMYQLCNEYKLVSLQIPGTLKNPNQKFQLSESLLLTLQDPNMSCAQIILEKTQK